jgi:dynactin-6
MAPPAPKPPTTLSPTLIIADTASLTGTHLIALGPNTAIHPRCKLNSTYASITIGSSCIISERSTIGLQRESENEVQSEGVVIEDGVVVEVGAVVEARCVGTGTVIEVGARVGRGSVVGKVSFVSLY